MLLPALAGAKEKAKVTSVHAELYGIGLALEMYSTDRRQTSAVRVNCNSDLVTHWCELPVELASEIICRMARRLDCDADLEDIFNPDHTYKYAAPGPELLNGSPAGNPSCGCRRIRRGSCPAVGKYFTDPKISPVRWVVWSLGPQPNSPKSSALRALEQRQLVSPGRRQRRHCAFCRPQWNTIYQPINQNRKIP